MTTVGDTIEYYKKNYCKSVGSTSSYESVAQKFPTLMKCSLDDLTPAMVVMAFNSLLGLKDSTKMLYYFNLKNSINKYCSDHNLHLGISLERLIKKSKQVNEVKYLVLDEVKKIKAFDPKKPRRRIAKDLFLLMCLSGMARSDAFKFDPEKHLTPDGKYFDYNRTKNGNLCMPPVLEAAREIIERYEGRWPLGREIGHMRTFNNHCEWIGEIVGKPVTPHTARRTMGCISLELGFSLEEPLHS